MQEKIEKQASESVKKFLDKAEGKKTLRNFERQLQNL